MNNFAKFSVTLVLGAAAYTASTSAYAGHESNGGYGIVDANGKLSSLDLAMRGVNLSPYVPIENEFKLSTDENHLLDRMLGMVASTEVLAIVKTKLAEFSTKIALTNIEYPAYYVIAHAADYTWIRQTDMNCLDVHDDDAPYPNKVQLAYRNGRYVRFCKGFDQLDAANQAGLIVHELIYAAHSEKSQTVNLVGYLFSDDFRIFDTIAQKELKDLLSELKQVSLAKGIHLNIKSLSDWDPRYRGIFDKDETVCFGKNDSGTLLFWSLPFPSTTCSIGPNIYANRIMATRATRFHVSKILALPHSPDPSLRCAGILPNTTDTGIVALWSIPVFSKDQECRAGDAILGENIIFTNPIPLERIASGKRTYITASTTEASDPEKPLHHVAATWSSMIGFIENDALLSFCTDRFSGVCSISSKNWGEALELNVQNYNYEHVDEIYAVNAHALESIKFTADLNLTGLKLCFGDHYSYTKLWFIPDQNNCSAGEITNQINMPMDGQTRPDIQISPETHELISLCTKGNCTLSWEHGSNFFLERN